jgi:hypothetical protein
MGCAWADLRDGLCVRGAGVIGPGFAAAVVARDAVRLILVAGALFLVGFVLGALWALA